MYPRTPPLTRMFSEECVPYPGSPVTGKLGGSERCAWSPEAILRAQVVGPYDRHDLRFELDEVFHRVASGL
jgi:hypothetical protein